MEGLLTYKFWILVFVFLRILGSFMLVPMMGGKRVPTILKVFIIAFISYLTIPNINETFPIDGDVMLIVYYMINNFLLGMSVGVILNIVIYAVQLAGEFFGMQTGFALANVLSPNFGDQSSLVSLISVLFATVTIFVIKGHLLFYSIIIESFQKIPTKFILNGMNYNLLAVKLGDVFKIGVQLALPITAFVLFVNVSLGILSRLMPQMNVFMVGMPLNILVGFLIFVTVIPLWGEQISKYFLEIYHWMEKIITSLG